MKSKRPLRAETLCQRQLLAADIPVGPDESITELVATLSPSPSRPVSHFTWGIVKDGAPIGKIDTNGSSPTVAEESNLDATLTTELGPRENWLPIFEQAFDAWSSISGVSFTYEENDDGVAQYGFPGETDVRADIRLGGFSEEEGNILATTAFAPSRDITFDTSDLTGDFTDEELRQRILAITVHEIGHSLGLGHETSGALQSVMGDRLNEEFVTPKPIDIEMVQKIFGDINEPNDSIASSIDLGTLSTRNSISLSDDTPVSIDGASDQDFYRFVLESDSTVSLDVDYRGVRPESRTELLRFEILDVDGNVVGFDSLLPSEHADSIFEFFYAGEYFIRVAASANNEISPYGINLSAYPTDTASSLANLVVTSLEVDSANKVAYQITNLGSQNVDLTQIELESFLGKDEFGNTDSGVSLGKITIDSSGPTELGAGESFSGTFSPSISDQPPGLKFLTLFVDSTNVVEESNNKDNTATVALATNETATNNLVEQINAANQSEVPVQIELDAGVYALDETLHITGSAEVTVIGQGADETTIDAGSLVQHINLHPGSTFVLQDVSLINGRDLLGGSIRVDRANLTLERVVISDSTATKIDDSGGQGGALNSDGGTISINDSVFLRNSAHSAGGSFYLLRSDVVIRNSIVAESEAAGIDEMVYPPALAEALRSTKERSRSREHESKRTRQRTITVESVPNRLAIF